MPDKKKRPYTTMKEFRIDEISGVDNPAQGPALAAIIKRATEEGEPFSKNPKDPVLLSSNKGHAHLIDASERGGFTSHELTPGAEFTHSHPWVRNNDGTVSIGEADGHSHAPLAKIADAADLAKAIVEFTETPEEYKADLARYISDRAQKLDRLADLPADGELATLIKAADSGESEEATMPQDNKDSGTAEAVSKALEPIQAELAVAKALASMTDEQKAFYALQSEDVQKTFRGLSPEDRQAEVEKAREDDPVVYTTDDGDPIRKSDGPRAEKAARKADRMERELAKQRTETENVRLEKRASDELGNCPGDVTVKAATLRAIDGIEDEDMRKGAQALLKAGNDALGKAFERNGDTTEPDVSDAETELNKKAEAYAEANGVPFGKAYKAVLNTPEGRRLLRETRS